MALVDKYRGVKGKAAYNFNFDVKLQFLKLYWGTTEKTYSALLSTTYWCSHKFRSAVLKCTRPSLNTITLWSWLTRSLAQVGVEALRLEHDEQGSPAQQHGGEEQVLDDCRHRHPPAAGEGCGEGGSHLSWVRGGTSLAWLEVRERLPEPGRQDGGDNDERMIMTLRFLLRVNIKKTEGRMSDDIGANAALVVKRNKYSHNRMVPHVYSTTAYLFTYFYLHDIYVNMSLYSAVCLIYLLCVNWEQLKTRI